MGGGGGGLQGEDEIGAPADLYQGWGAVSCLLAILGRSLVELSSRC